MIANNFRNNEVEWVSPPSETVLRLLKKKKININLFREQLELNVSDFIDFLHDKLEVSSQMALLLSQLLGSSELFWMNRYREFNEFVVLSDIQAQQTNSSFLSSLSEIRCTDIRSLSTSFKVSTLEHLIVDYYESPRILYSRNQKFEPSAASLANWIRECELYAETTIVSQPVPFFNPEVLERIIPEVISLSKVNNVLKITSRIKKLLHGAGIVLVLSPSEKGYGVSGFTKKLLKGYRLVVVTDRYKNNAAFWFTLLHELAHCMLHSINQTLIHYSDEEFILANSSSRNVFEEEEANKYVESILFPDDLKSQLSYASRSYKTLIKLAVSFEIPASLVAAQMHRTKLAPYSYFRKVYQKVGFDSIF